MNTDQYLIGELANLTGLTVRTIRYYINEGLLPQPEIQGRYAYFDEHYLARIKLIQRLKDAYMPLKEIRQILDSLSDEEIDKQANEEDLSNLNENLMVSSKNRDVLDYIKNINQNQNRIQSPEPTYHQRSSKPSGSRQILNLEPSSQAEGSQWRRIELQKGIELHINENIMKRRGGRIFSIVEHFKRALHIELQEGRNEK